MNPILVPTLDELSVEFECASAAERVTVRPSTIADALISELS